MRKFTNPHPSTCSCSRRTFLRGSGLVLTGFGLGSLFPTPLMQPALAGTLPADRKLLFVFLRGGNDAINAVIPHGDADYSPVNRPSLYISPTEAIDLNGFASLHPALGDMVDPYNAGELAVIHRVGYANSSQSHFDGQRIWENGDPSNPQMFEGWLYRYTQEAMISAGADLPVLTVQSTQPVLVRGEGEKFVNVANPGFFDYIAADPDIRAKLGAGWRSAYEGLTGLETYRPVLNQTGVKLADTIDEYASWDQANWNPLDPVSGWSLFPVSPETNQAGFNATSYGFFESLKVAALSLLEGNGTTNNTRIAGTQLNGFDTHNNQGQMNGAHAELLSWLAYGYKSLRTVLSGAAVEPRGYASIWNDTLVVTLSEFGRTTVENGSQGTDHAAAGALFAMAPPRAP